MDPSQFSQQPPQEPSVEEWFNGPPSDKAINTPIPVTPLPPANEPPKKSKKPLALIGTALGALILIGGSILTYSYLSTKSCLSASDYRDFTGKDMDGQQAPNTDFYTSLISFEENSDAYTDASQAEIKKMIDFYANHNNTSIVFTITSEYGSEDADAMVANRNNTVVSYLISQGISVDDIRTSEPSQVVSEGELSDDELASLTNTYISISSAETCR